MDSFSALTFVLGSFAIGDIIATKTKSVVSMLFTVSVIFLIGFWFGLPVTIFEDSQLLGVGSLTIVMLLTHLGTMLDINELKVQWKTVIIAVSSIFGVFIFMMLLVGPFLGFEYAFVAAPPLAGGVIAGLQMGEAATQIGNENLSILATLLVVIQGFVGYPLASICLKKEAKHILSNKHQTTIQEGLSPLNTKEDKEKLLDFIPEKYHTSNVHLAKNALVSMIAIGLSAALTQLAGTTIIDKNIMALLMGVVFCELGFLEKNNLNKGNSFGFLMAAITAVIISSLSKATPTVIVNLLPAIILSLFAATIGILIFSSLSAKFLKVSRWMAMAIGISALFGFPGTYIVTNEVSTAVARNSEEKELLMDTMLPQMLVAGFITVSIGSVILAGILAPILVSQFS
ncbi:hypothetical protein HZY91_07315 [Facklamia sp. DSM 111018]|uniref:Integral membrane protein n=1 Tax=Facklamia lactis TaxID=2749967 RepID=A0ABS0LRC6_9LACT|nr:hypothetical protein [Facklamia lactis]MBG9980934.1 hypothetical protein [Facklamia lactis]MBG9986703.1 hypothetical protein [Facklamia lactis]